MSLPPAPMLQGAKDEAARIRAMKRVRLNPLGFKESTALQALASKLARQTGNHPADRNRA